MLAKYVLEALQGLFHKILITIFGDKWYYLPFPYEYVSGSQCIYNLPKFIQLNGKDKMLSQISWTPKAMAIISLLHFQKGGHLIAAFRKRSLTESKQVVRPSGLAFYYIK